MIMTKSHRFPSFTTLIFFLLLGVSSSLAQDQCVNFTDYPHLETNLALPGITYGINAQGNFLFTASHVDGLQVIDISDPFFPVKVGGQNTPGQSREVVLSGDYAYVADGFEGLQIIDISESPSLQLVGSLNTLGFVKDVVVVGDLAYLAASWDGAGLFVVDISDPANPILLGHAEAGGDARSVAVYGQHAYISDFDGHIYVYDVSDPTTPQLIRQVVTESQPLSLAISDGHLVVSCHFWGIQVFDLIQPADPQLAGALPFGPYLIQVGKISTVNGSAYLSVAYHALVINIEDPGNPYLELDLKLPASSEAVIFHDNIVYAALGDDGIQAQSYEGWGLPAPLGNSLDFPPGPIVVHGDYAYVASDGLKIVDLRNDSYLDLVGSYQTGNDIEDVVIHNNHAYLTKIHSDLIFVYNMTDPQNPDFVNSFIAEDSEFMAVAGDYLYSAGGYQKAHLVVNDISNPSQATEVEELYTSFYLTSLTTQGNRLYLGGVEKFAVFDISDGAHPVALSYLDLTDGIVRGVTVQGDRAYLAVEGMGLVIVDISQPALQVIGLLEMVNPVQVTLRDNIAYVSDKDEGLCVIDISNETEPQWLGVKRGECLASAFAGDHLLASGSGFIAGLELLPAQCSSLSPIVDFPQLPALLELKAHPNPFNPQTQFSFKLETYSVVQLTVHDLAGKRVRQLIQGISLPKGMHDIQWDGRDDQGRLLASGQYFGRLRAGQYQATRSVILVK